jgi:hypothetical protein
MTLIKKIDNLGRNTVGSITSAVQKATFNINNANFIDGTAPFGTIGTTTTTVVCAFVNGIECNFEYCSRLFAPATTDIIADTVSATYPTTLDLYWNGSARIFAPSTLGNLVLGDTIRIYYLNFSY